MKEAKSCGGRQGGGRLLIFESPSLFVMSEVADLLRSTLPFVRTFEYEIVSSSPLRPIAAISRGLRTVSRMSCEENAECVSNHPPHTLPVDDGLYRSL